MNWWLYYKFTHNLNNVMNRLVKKKKNSESTGRLTECKAF